MPGGVGGGDLPSIFRTADLSPVVLLVSILTAAALGAGHALTPGHGKTLMAAYLVGTRGTPLHAAGLGLSVTVSHTLGILVLAALVVGARGSPAAGPGGHVGAGRRGRSRSWPSAAGCCRRGAAPLARSGGRAIARRWRMPTATPTTTTHDARPRRTTTTTTTTTLGHADDPAGPGVHSHGGVSHSHLPPAGTTISWRSLFVLGLAGGLIPSTSALLILLGSIAAGRPAFGFVLVVAFGLGMALVMGGIGLALVLARGRLDRVDGASTLGRVSGSCRSSRRCWCSGSACT